MAAMTDDERLRIRREGDTWDSARTGRPRASRYAPLSAAAPAATVDRAEREPIGVALFVRSNVGPAPPSSRVRRRRPLVALPKRKRRHLPRVGDGLSLSPLPPRGGRRRASSRRQVPWNVPFGLAAPTTGPSRVAGVGAHAPRRRRSPRIKLGRTPWERGIRRLHERQPSRWRGDWRDTRTRQSTIAKKSRFF